jgi:hypothetical protein
MSSPTSALPDHRCRHAEPRRDVLGAHAVLGVQLGECLVLVGGVHRALQGILGKADFCGNAFRQDMARDRSIGPNLLPLG